METFVHETPHSKSNALQSLQPMEMMQERRVKLDVMVYCRYSVLKTTENYSAFAAKYYESIKTSSLSGFL